MTDQALTSLFRGEMGVSRKQFGNLGFDSLGKQLPRAARAELR
jgi:hypothetical protein